MNGALRPRRSGLALAVRDLELTVTDNLRSRRVVLRVDALDAAAGTTLAIAGPSGCGKTTLLDALAALRAPAGGSIRWGAVDIGAIAPEAAERWRYATLGLIFQHFHLFGALSALENVLLPLRFARWSIPDDLRQAALGLLDRVGVAPASTVARLSRGEQQRVALARALLRTPAIVIADEPTASLDPATGSHVADLMCALAQERGTTLVVATHDAALAERMDARYEIRNRRLESAKTATNRVRSPASSVAAT